MSSKGRDLMGWMSRQVENEINVERGRGYRWNSWKSFEKYCRSGNCYMIDMRVLDTLMTGSVTRE